MYPCLFFNLNIKTNGISGALSIGNLPGCHCRLQREAAERFPVIAHPRDAILTVLTFAMYRALSQAC